MWGSYAGEFAARSDDGRKITVRDACTVSGNPVTLPKACRLAPVTRKNTILPSRIYDVKNYCRRTAPSQWEHSAAQGCRHGWRQVQCSVSAH